MYTYQDFIKEPDVITGITNAINNHKNSPEYKTAVSADNYDRMQNETIRNYIQTIFNLLGQPMEDFTASNNKLCSNFFHRLNTQRCTYLLGNGVSFTDHIVTTTDETGVETKTDTTKEKLGEDFDSDLKDIGYFSLIHGVSFGFWNLDKLHVFPLTQFKPLWDEETGELRAGIRFWQIDKNKPTIAVLYEEDGYSKYKTNNANNAKFELVQDKRAYKSIVSSSEVRGEEIIGEENYGILPIVPLWGSRLHQSTLIGMKEKIDSYDLVRSGFANDLTDCAQVYWILENCSGMSDKQLDRFRDRLKTMHIAVADTINSQVTPYTQDIPYGARKAYLDEIRSGIYEDFGGLDVHTVAAGATNDHIDAAYQPLDEEADDFEYQIIKFIQQVLKIIDIVDTPVFKRNRISNQKEQTDMILSAADHLDEETILRKLPFISVDEVSEILVRIAQDEESRFEEEPQNGPSFGQEEEDESTSDEENQN